MSIYIGNDLEDRLKALEAKNASLRKYKEYHQVVHEIDHMLDSSFYKRSMKIDNYFKINEWIDHSIGQSTVIQQLNKKRPTLSNSNQMQNRRRYINFENGSHLICSFNLNNPESTVCIGLRLNSIASGNNLLLNGIIGNSIKYVAFFKTHSGLGLLISMAYNGSYVTVAKNDSSFLGLDYKFPSSKSDCTILNKWHVISVTWSNGKNLSNCWSNGEKLIILILVTLRVPITVSLATLTHHQVTHTNRLHWRNHWFYRSLTDKETSYIHKYLMKKCVIDDPI